MWGLICLQITLNWPLSCSAILTSNNFMAICYPHKQHQVAKVTIRLQLFWFSLNGAAWLWLNSLTSNATTTWQKMAKSLSSMHFLASRIVQLRNEITFLFTWKMSFFMIHMKDSNTCWGSVPSIELNHGCKFKHSTMNWWTKPNPLLIQVQEELLQPKHMLKSMN